jgi:hypothetical protein
VVESVAAAPRWGNVGALAGWLTQFKLAVVAGGVALAGHNAAQQVVLEDNKNELSLLSWDGTNKVSLGVILLAGAAVIVVKTGFWKRWIFWRREPEPEESARRTVAATFIALALLTEVFALATAMFFAFGLFDLPTEVERGALVSQLEANFAWGFIDAIPLIDIPKTVNWELSYEFDDLGTGAFFMVYKLLVILPMLGLVKQLRERPKHDESRAKTADAS